MGDVGVGEQVVVGPDAGDGAVGGGAVDGDVLAEGVVAPDFGAGDPALVLEVLRLQAEAREGINLVVGAEGGVPVDDDVAVEVAPESPAADAGMSRRSPPPRSSCSATRPHLRTRTADANPTATEDEIGWAMVRKLSIDAAKLLEPAFDQYAGRNGRLSIQTDPRFYRDAKRLARRLVADELVFTAPKAPGNRAMPPEELQALAGRGHIEPTVKEAYDWVLKQVTAGDAIIITGSLYLVGEARSLFLVTTLGRW